MRLDAGLEASILSRRRTWSKLLAASEDGLLWAGSSPVTGLGIEAQTPSSPYLALLDGLSGDILDEWELAGSTCPVTGLALFDGEPLVATEEGLIHLLDAKSGTVSAHKNIRNAGELSPQIAAIDGLLCIVTSGGIWLFEEKKTLRKLANFDIAPLRIAVGEDDMLYLADRTSLYAISPEAIRRLSAFKRSHFKKMWTRFKNALTP